MAKVAVVILNWNGREFLEKFLPSVVAHSAADTELIVADNASSDNSVAFLRKNYPGIRLIENSENGGFAQGYNDALQHVDAEYYVLLNSDVEVVENWIAPPIEMMESDSSIGACQPKIRSYHERERFEYAGAAGGYIDRYGYPFCRGRIFDSLEKDDGQYDEECEVFWATGACMFVRAELFHRLGGFDVDFFAHMEEIDLCWRMKICGSKVMYCPMSLVYHVGGGTLPKISPRKTYLNFRNNLFMLAKNLPVATLIAVVLVRLALDLFAALLFLLKGQFGDAAAVFKAYFSVICSVPALRYKRKKLRQKKVGQVYQASLVVEHFMKKTTAFSRLDAGKFS